MDKVAAALDVAMPRGSEVGAPNAGVFGGGNMPYSAPNVVVGYVDTKTGGREDRHRVDVPAGCYVIPADVVSGKGQGNSKAGADFFDAWLKGPYGSTKPKRASGGGVGVPRTIDISGGEYVIPPEVVQQFGKGDISRGHDYFDRFVKAERSKLIDTLRKLPGPKKDD